MAPTGKEDCPVDFILAYIDRIHPLFPKEGTKYLFPSLSGKGVPLPKHISYSSARSQLRKVVEKLNPPETDRSRYSMHSGRVGVASSSFNAGL